MAPQMAYVSGCGAEREVEPVVYVRYLSDGSHYWATLKNDDVSNNLRMCCCGAKVSLQPCFSDPTHFQSTTVVVGSKIYSFGGYEFSTKKLSDQVSYIDTLHPDNGWNVCKSKMLRAQSGAYALTLDDKERVFVVGGETPDLCSDPTFTQMYYPKTDEWVLLENNFRNPEISGHAVVAKGETILMHSYNSPRLYSYVVDQNSWDLYWGEDFGDSKHTSAFVDGIYYVLDVSPLAITQNLHFSGYDISLKSPKRLPVEVKFDRDEKDDEDWMPILDWDGYSVAAELVSLGNSKLAMVWENRCLANKNPHDEKIYQKISVWCSIFRMIQERNDDGVLNLVAQPLSNVCYHLDGHFLDRRLLVCPSENISPNKKRKRIDEEEEKDEDKDD